MARHAAPRRRVWFGSGRTRAVLSLGVVLALGVAGTTAYWTDTAAVSTGPVTSGAMDLQVAQTTAGPWGAVGTGTAFSASHVTVPNLTPSEAYAFPLAVRNVGQADFTYTATVTQGGSPAWTFVGTPIQVQLYAGSPVTVDTTYPVQQTCGGTALTASPVTVTAGSTIVTSAARRVDAGATDAQLCVLVSMVSTADNANQGRQGQLRFDLSATQVTS
ncbi:putative ribosomally synthesized peptide with SipW-like signal peptide [Nocardioides thalensis]|uniref:Putative ribosomally synthesized peptide with SipW-like signal peptide n=1 Tax=Nocardioides thalensis TaxID=1914755 RepID=A0A853C046_9ACTN|nr:SipW-dependent-type signal peptide-containing protein [Nocardioides thalensis]NYJ01600.1 putative ribosomally synthesized peptide with SipW-like signal peptide [Nocardioides thalensis]